MLSFGIFELSSPLRNDSCGYAMIVKGVPCPLIDLQCTVRRIRCFVCFDNCAAITSVWFGLGAGGFRRVFQVVQDQKNPAFLAQRKTDLEAYLKQVSIILCFMSYVLCDCDAQVLFSTHRICLV